MSVSPVFWNDVSLAVGLIFKSAVSKASKNAVTTGKDRTNIKKIQIKALTI